MAHASHAFAVRRAQSRSLAATSRPPPLLLLAPTHAAAERHNPASLQCNLNGTTGVRIPYVIARNASKPSPM
jgi:hypothetical protein